MTTHAERIAPIVPDLIEIRHDIHRHPELAYHEHRTAEVIRKHLTELGIEHVGDLGGGTGTLGYLPGKGEKAILLRADIDALPIHEETGLPYASTIEGKMHACGHDGHVSILLGAARILKEMSDEGELTNPVLFCFQPAEEGGGGGLKMVEDGVLDGTVIGPPAARAFGLHGWPKMPLGQAGSIPGPMLAAADRFELLVEGTGGHAAAPQYARDPVLCAAHIVTALQALVSRESDPLDAVVLTVAAIHAGDAFNVIPRTATIGGTVRTLLPESRSRMRDRIASMAGAVAEGFGCATTLRWFPGYPVTNNVPELVDLVHAKIAESKGQEAVCPMEAPVMGAEDFSYYGEKVPACFFALGLCPDGMDMPNVHESTFDFNDQAIPLGVETMVRLALEPLA